MKDVRPPRVAEWLVATLAPVEVREHLQGDLDEQLQLNAARRGAAYARRRYWRQALSVLRHWPTGSAERASQARASQENFMSALFQDLRFAAWQLVRQPSYLAIGVVSLALAIAANGVVFGLVNSLILNPFSFPDASRLISISGAFPSQDMDPNFIEQHSPGEVQDLATIPVIEKLAAWDLGNRVLSNGTTAERFFTALILYDPVPAMGVPMTLGRSFSREELAPGGPKVAIISHRTWVRMFGGDPNIIGKTVTVNADPTMVVGVLGAGSPLFGTDLWIPWGIEPSMFKRNMRQSTVLARLKDGATMDDVNAALRTVSARAKANYAAEYPEYADWQLAAAPWSQAIIGNELPAGFMLLAAGAIVLLVGCANVASLMLARLATRHREFAVRRALGASPWRLVGLLMFESLLLAGVGAAAGMALAYLAMGQLPSMLPSQVAQLGFELRWNTTAVLYCVLAGVAATGLTMVIPAWHLRSSGVGSLTDGRSTSSPSRQRGRRLLIVSEVALAVTLLVVGGLFYTSYGRIASINPGFDSGKLLTMRLTIDPRKYPDAAAATFFTNLITKLEAIPGVVGAAAANQMPTMAGFSGPVAIEGASTPASSQSSVLLTVGSANRAALLKTPLVSGRDLTDRDVAGSPFVVVVNQAFSRRFLNGAATGRVLIGEERIPVEVVGVLADAANQSLIGPVRPEIFATMAQAGRGNNQYFLMVRGAGDAASLLPAVRRAVAELDPNPPVYMVQTMDEAIASQVFPQRLAMILVGVFAIGALIAALIGVYGLISQWVVSRNREMGIRIALGGNRRQVMGLVVGQAARLVGWGALFGLIGGVGAGFAAARLLFNTRPTDPATLAIVITLLAVVGVAAAFVPARRAVSVNPIDVLRAD
jgi:putative ABC transport system permease protein